ncbi:hypothetical protein [Chromobacterium sp. ASV23]|uniref:hypothetical protein n=1 Tax=Chromobacterium sp. ASV23 TaxID=2795110 RepID=UPI0018EDE428|nr:hypothetical protein [Chromobacterium sp. ASV23]
MIKPTHSPASRSLPNKRDEPQKKIEEPRNPRIDKPTFYPPGIPEQIENIRELSGWDENTTALLKIIASKLHLSGKIGDHLLEELMQFDGNKQHKKSLTEDLKCALRDIAAELENNPDEYYEALFYQSVAKISPQPLVQNNHAVKASQDNHAVTTRILSDMADGVLKNVVYKLVIESVPIKDLHQLKINYDELCKIYNDNYTSQDRLERLHTALEHLDTNIANLWGKNPALAPALKPLQSCLEAIMPWLKSVSHQWQTLEYGIQEYQNHSSVFDKFGDLLAMTNTILSDQKLQDVIGKTSLDSIRQHVSALEQTFAQFKLLQNLPDDSDLLDYVNILIASPLARQALDASLLQLAQALASVRRGYPSEGSLDAKITWLTSTLAEPGILSHLERWLADKPQANQIIPLLHFAGQLRHFPIDGSLCSQALWLLQQASGHAPALAWTQSFQAELGTSTASLALLNRLLAINQNAGSWSGLMFDFAKELAPSALWLAARSAANTLLPQEAVRKLEKFYQESTANESWYDWSKRLASSTASLVIPSAFAALTQDPLAAATMRYAQAIADHRCFDDTLRWFVANDPSDDKQLQFVYGQYLNAMLMWEAYQAFNSSTPEAADNALCQLAAKLKEYGVVKHYPQLETLIDLIPLLPALREAQREVGALRPADTWLAWASQWLDALAGSQNKNMQELREKLSRKVENWLADAAMSACGTVIEKSREGLGSLWAALPSVRDPLTFPTALADDGDRTSFSPDHVQQAFTLGEFGRAADILEQMTSEKQAAFTSRYPETAALLKDRMTGTHTGDVTRSLGPMQLGLSTPLPREEGAAATVASRSNGANWQLGAGLGLEAVGLAAIAYGLWQARQAGRVAAPATDDIEATLINDSNDQGKDVGSLTQSSLIAKAAPTVPSSLGNRLMEQKIPLLLGLAAVTTGAGVLGHYAWSRRGVDDPSPASDSDYQKALAIFQENPVPDLDFLFYDELADTPPEGGATATATRTSEMVSVETLLSRRKRNADTDSASIQTRIDRLLREERLSDYGPIRALFEGVNQSSDVKHLIKHQRPQSEINVMKLLKAIELYDMIPKFFDDETIEKCRPIIDGLWQIADNLSDEYGRSKVAEYKKAFLIQSAKQKSAAGQGTSLTSTPEAAVTTEAPRVSAQLLSDFERYGRKTLEDLAKAYSPILNPSDFIDKFIEEGIRRFEKSKGISLGGLGPNSGINVNARHVISNVGGGSIQTDYVYTHSLKDIITGHYLYEYRSGPLNDWRLNVANPIYKELIASLKTDDLSSKMVQALSNYRNNPDNRSILTTHYQNMLRERCEKYKESPNKIPAYEEAVQKFLNGEIQATEVTFNKHKLNGVFFIPLAPPNSQRGVLFSVDDPNFFHVSDKNIAYDGLFGRATAVVPSMPLTTDFKDWVLSKLPVYYASEYKHSPLSMFESSVKYHHNDFAPEVPEVVNPFGYTASRNPPDLANKLFDGFMERLDSDIDKLLFTRSEQITEETLEMAKGVLAVFSSVLAFVPCTGPLLSRISLFMTNLAIDTAYVTATAMQAQQANRPEDAAAYRNEAIIAGVVGGLVAVPSGVQTTREAARQARILRQQVKTASASAIPSLLKHMNWEKLMDSRKIDLLADTMKNSETAKELARLTSADAVEQSIRRNLQLDGLGQAKSRFTWGKLPAEQAQVQRRLNSDLTRLQDATRQLDWIREQKPIIPRRTLSGGPEDAAARWIVSRSRTASTGVDTVAQPRIRQALIDFRQADLLDFDTLERIHNAVYMPPPGQQARTFRSSSDPTFMGSDIARAGFKRALGDIRIKVQAGEMDLSEALYTVITRYHPYGDGNGRTARTAYALAQLQNQQPGTAFKALTEFAEEVLNPPLGQSVNTGTLHEQLRVLVNREPEALPEEMTTYLSELRQIPEINAKMLSPLQNCEAIVDDAVKFMRSKGMDNIRYRGMYLWANGSDNLPGNHFVVLGDINGETFVFDLTAAQFSNKGMPSLDQPLILREADWAKRYESATTTKLIKYKDFDRFNDARHAFNSIDQRLPDELIDGAYVLAKPRWYKA